MNRWANILVFIFFIAHYNDLFGFFVPCKKIISENIDCSREQLWIRFHVSCSILSNCRWEMISHVGKRMFVFPSLHSHASPAINIDLNSLMDGKLNWLDKDEMLNRRNFPHFECFFMAYMLLTTPGPLAVLTVLC